MPKRFSRSGSAKKRRRLLTCLLAAFLVNTMLLAVAASASALSFGVGWGDYNPEQLATVKRSGGTVYRLDLDYRLFSGGNWSGFDQVVEAGREQGITILPVLIRSTLNGEAERETRFLSGSDPEWGAWGAWAREAVERYGINGSFWWGKTNPTPITAWEVWNEPNLPANNPILNGEEKVQPENYGRFLKYTSEQLQAGSVALTSHGTEVLFGGIYMPGGQNYKTFLEKASSVSGVPAAYTGVGIHPYSFIGGFQEMTEQVNGVRNALDTTVAGGFGKPLWITEIGWPVSGSSGFPTGGHPVSETEQASLLTQGFNWIKGVAASKKISSVVWYNLQDWNSGSNWSGSCGLRRANGSFRPSWYAFQEQMGMPVWPRGRMSYQAPNGQLFWLDDQATVNTTQGMMAGTSPSIVRLTGGGYEMAFQSSGGQLISVGDGGSVNWQQGMMKGTSPSIAALPNNGYVIAFQANNGELVTIGTQGGENTRQGMKAGTSPSITSLSGGGYEVAFQANNSQLFLWGTAAKENTLQGMMAGTSPAITGLFGGGYEVAFQANNSQLFRWGTAGNVNTGQGMMKGTSPSITALPYNGWEVAFQSNAGELFRWGTAGSGSTSQSMMSGTSPSIAFRW